ncbi:MULTISPECIES: argininosuccinate synthase [Aminobacterium]|jgi:argininosuccinate synthase|uniref:Argininosuccinate synthase n=1 Tax=Aminobacterium colombiense (strain DSM 12261 / ALA-1) TaxID=572547 RepID=D5EFG5_AMICL|nr:MULTISPECIES: argininosuccinate synthase [Aminobacterium]MDD2378442.1 argininosuccinate synthase [Aminobacterium colombiense]ADE57297.1 argininosuccinate synthase [Aminobacterium colombiense DSM 12261]MDD3768346.1 argininosuccinate synthase [Aminobacterium colombiense]MDD4264905.1 argininosuccinate synthase [Aminobacterium colombiense]MDD4586166.1 argininosuccinate synthase [Aminobacterium colombiense]
MLDKKKVVLAYSGGLDTSVATMWLKEQGYEVITMTADVGQQVDLEAAKQKALKSGASKAYVMDLKQEFVKEFVWPALKANAMYQGTYPLNSALSRPLIAKVMAMVAKKENAGAVAHGCTGKGQDQVRIEVCTNALNPELDVLAPVRDWHFSREAEMEYAQAHDIPVMATTASPYSIDENIWGRSIECGILEDPWNEPPADAYTLTVDPWNAPDHQEFVEITFEKGIPVALNGEAMDGPSLIQTLNEQAGKHGVGRIDMVEDRLVGFKSREVYECPAAMTLIAAHKALETLTLDKKVLASKKELEVKYAELTYEGYWYSPLKEAIDSFVDTTQEYVNGVVKVRFYKGQAVVRGMKSPNSIYQQNLATYSEGDAFDHAAAVGFIKIWGLPVKTWKQVHKDKMPVEIFC